MFSESKVRMDRINNRWMHQMKQDVCTLYGRVSEANQPFRGVPKIGPAYVPAGPKVTPISRKSISEISKLVPQSKPAVAIFKLVLPQCYVHTEQSSTKFERDTEACA